MYVHTYVHTYLHTYVHTYVHTYGRTYVWTYIRNLQANEKYKEDNMNLREEAKALQIELSAQKEKNSSALATRQEESRA